MRKSHKKKVCLKKKKGHKAKKVRNHWWRSFLLNRLWSTWISGQLAPQDASLRDSTHLKVWRQREKTEKEGGRGDCGLETSSSYERKADGEDDDWRRPRNETVLSFYGGWKSSERSDGALWRSMKRASIIQQLWIMGQHAGAVAQIRGVREKETCGVRLDRTRQAVQSETFKPPKMSPRYFLHLFTTCLPSFPLALNAAWRDLFKAVSSLSQLSSNNVFCRWRAPKRRQGKFQNFPMKNPQKWQK